jgi:predicted permease
MLISALICVALLAVSFAHLLWSFGVNWPTKDEKLLARTVTGFANAERMPPRWMSFGVAVLTFAAAVWALALADHDGGGVLLTLIGAALGLVFLARGIIGFTPGWAQKTPEEPFRTNDRRVYSPLCIALGVGFLVLVLMRLL